MNHSFFYRTLLFFAFSILLCNPFDSSAQVKWNKHFIFDRIAAQNKAAISKDGKHAITVGYMNTYHTCSDATITDPFNKSLSWKKGTIDGFSNLTSVAYFSNQGVIVSNDEGMLFRSTNHGLEWSTIELEKNVPISCIRHIQDSILLTSTSNGSLFRSTDSGLSWALVKKVEFGLNDLSFGKNGYVLAIGQKGLILESKDLGKTWKKTAGQAPNSVNLISVSYVLDSTWVIAGDTSYVARTTNNGNSWEYIITDTSKKNRKFNVSFTSFTDSGIGIIIDYNMFVPEANIFFTWDGGKTWKPGWNIYFDGIPDILQITDIQFFPGTLSGIASGSNDRVSSIRIIKDSLPYSYERMPMVTQLGNSYSPSNFYVSAGNVTYFRTVNTLAKQFLKEHDLSGKVIKEWRFADSSSRYKYVSAQRLNDKHIIIYVDSTKLFSTTRLMTLLIMTKDGGNTWDTIRPFQNSPGSLNKFDKGYWRDSFNGLINTNPSGKATVITSDGGITWKSIEHPIEYAKVVIESFSLDSTSYIGIATKSNDKSMDLVSLNDKHEWKVLLSNIPQGRLIIKDPQNLFIHDGNNITLLSISSNGNFASQRIIGPSNIQWMTTRGKSLWIGKVLLHAEKTFDIRYSLDSGMTFIPIKDEILNKLRSRFEQGNSFLPKSFISIGNRALLHTDEITLLSDPIDFATNIQETTSDIYTNPPYPNPFSKSTTIAVDWLFTLSAQALTLKVYNSIGEEVRDLTKDLHAQAQNYRSSLVFDAGNLPDGVYYVVCKGGNHTSTQRLIIAR
jgi:photosystem II stability/assembly factor-like uncharacterized protein